MRNDSVKYIEIELNDEELKALDDIGKRVGLNREDCVNWLVMRQMKYEKKRKESNDEIAE